MISNRGKHRLNEIILLRHGETHWNREGRYQGQRDSPLTLTGIAQIRAVARTLMDQIPNICSYELWCSSIGRAKQSVAILCEETGINFHSVQFDERLIERSFGAWEGKTHAEIEHDFPSDIIDENADKWNFKNNKNGESYADVAHRLNSWMTEISGHPPILVVTHGGSGRVIRGLYRGLPASEIFAFDEPQTNIFRLAGGTETCLPASPAHLEKLGCANAGLRVAI